jgi:hypothetical protein
VNDEQKAKRQLASQWSKFPAQPGKLHLAREHRRHAELRQFADMPADESVEPLVFWAGFPTQLCRCRIYLDQPGCQAENQRFGLITIAGK